MFSYLNAKTNNKGYFTAHDFNSLFHIAVPSLRQVIRIYDKDNDFALNKNEFTSLIVPRFIDELAINEEDLANESSFRYFGNLIDKEAKMAELLNQLICEVKQCKDFTIYEAFIAIANDSKYITESKLKTFLQKGKNANCYYDEDIANIIFRFDKDNDNAINYEDFKEMFFPLLTINTTKTYNPMNEEMSKNEKCEIKKGNLYFNYSNEFPNEYNNNNTNKPFDYIKYTKQRNRFNDISLSLSNSQSVSSALRANSHLTETITSSKSNKDELLLSLFKEIIHNELKCERLKQALSHYSEINLPDTFAIFDIEDTAYISSHSFKSILQSYFDINTTQNAIDMLYHRYDNDCDEQLSYREFSQMLLPSQIEYARMIITHRPPPQFALSIEAKSALGALFSSLLEGEEKINKKRNELCSLRNFSCYEMFEAIKRKSSQSIYKNDLQSYLERNSVNLLSSELDILMRRFTNTNAIAFNDFIRNIIPHKTSK